MLAGTSLLSSPDEDYWAGEDPWFSAPVAHKHHYQQSWVQDHPLLAPPSRPHSRRSVASSTGTKRSTRPSTHAAKEIPKAELDEIVRGTGFTTEAAVIVPLDQGPGIKDDKELHVLKFKSSKTGMGVVWVNAEGEGGSSLR